MATTAARGMDWEGEGHGKPHWRGGSTGDPVEARIAAYQAAKKPGLNIPTEDQVRAARNASMWSDDGTVDEAAMLHYEALRDHREQYD